MKRSFASFGCSCRRLDGRDLAAFTKSFCRQRRRQLQRALILGVALFAFCVAELKAITLDAALARTLEKNPVIQGAKTEVEQAAGRRLVLRSIGLPNVRMQVLGGVQGGKRAGQKPTQPFGTARGFFTQPLFNAAIPSSGRRGNVEILLAQQRLNVAIVEQLHATRIAFYTALFDDSLRQLGEAQRKRLAENVSTQSARYEAGQADRGAVASAKLLEQELNPHIEEARRGYQGALLALATSMGDHPRPRKPCPTRWNVAVRDH